MIPIKPTFARVRAARYSGWFEGRNIWAWRLLVLVVMTATAAGLWFDWHASVLYVLVVAAILLSQFLLWWKLYLKELPVEGDINAQDIDISALADPILLRKARKVTTPQELWQALEKTWPSRFILNRLLINYSELTSQISNEANDMERSWADAHKLSQYIGAESITAGSMVASLLLGSEGIQSWLQSRKLQTDDVINTLLWQHRTDKVLDKIQQKRLFGGLARDWAAGYTPLLNRFGHSISSDVEHGAYQHVYLQTHSDSLEQILATLAQHAQNSIALIGKTGSGKTSISYALAERLLDPRNDKLQYYKIFSISSTAIVSEANRSGNLESLLTHVIAEAKQAGNIILFFDDAHSFFAQETGGSDMTNILSQVVANSAVRMMFAFRPESWQKLSTSNPDIAANLQQFQITEPTQGVAEKVLQDQTLAIESEKGVIISYLAIKEAYRLADRYIPDQAFPGKGVALLKSSAANASDGWVAPETLQQTIEAMTGTKVSSANAQERDVLLNLEEHLHQYMINQSYAVGVVADALRRARAGVRNQNQPVGGFLFLGPTGVGKTELSKALAAVYFGGRENIIRLDMSEYNQSDSTQRLLAPAGEQGTFLTAIRTSPFSVVLLDEIEKASEEVMNLLLQMLDEGQLTDMNGREVSFKDAIIITTSNAGADIIRSNIESGQDLKDFSNDFIGQLINQQHFKPELINRFDEVVLFRPLDKNELLQVVALLLQEVNDNLASEQITVSLTEAAAQAIVDNGYDPRLGARPMRRVMQRTVENVVSKRLLSQELQPGNSVTLDETDLEFQGPS